MTSPARRRFRAIARLPDDQINLAEAALCIAWEDQGDSNLPASLQAIDAMAAAARERIADGQGARAIVAALNAYLFEELGFRGNYWNYSDPANSFLDQVIARRVGLPILLSVLYLEIGWRLRLPMVGLALPGHFLVRYIDSQEGDLYIDPFNRGRLWSYAECERQIAAFTGNTHPALIQKVMAPPSRRSILIRILRNLKSAYIQREQFERALAAVDRILLLAFDASELRDRGLLRARIGHWLGALADFEHYAHLAPQAGDLEAIQHQAQMLADALAPHN
ncbi:MAG: transglutaminase-like domain-containing protein [Roseiflexus sp.]|nr:transglutaminase-like domain-containing protein [Roseiflexus sp.]MCS7288157.1 transglutaminase-like domain-containing protein [Roseiflexus sp.]MDW8232577.1 transglutaminase-like domain-containing protein [Roseiflexaceae bacterium]